MILLAVLLAAQAALPDAPNDIVVTGRRLERIKRLRLTTKLDHKTGVTRCIFKRHSGDLALDMAICDAVLACVSKTTTVVEMRGCVTPTMNALVAKDVAWRADAAKSGR